MLLRIAPAAAAAALVVTLPAAAGQWSCTFAPESRYSQTTAIQLPLAGTWIGDYDAVTNPTGTQTRPGLFGGSGNVAIPFSSVVKPTAQITDATPLGGYGLSLDTATGAVEVTGFTADLLGGQAGSIGTDIALTFSSFRTFAPNSTFFGVSNLNVPLESGTLDVATANQTGPAVGAATLNKDGSWSFAVSVPVDVAVAGAAIGQPFASVTPGVLAFAGTIAFEGAGVRVTSQASTQETAPVPPGPPLVNVPFPLPTILPPGATANLLITGEFGAGSASIAFDGTLVATGTPTAVPGDMNADGLVDGSDLGALLRVWGQAHPVADFTNDGTVDGRDLAFMLAHWTR